MNLASSELTFDGKSFLLIYKPSDYEDFNLLSDMFQEVCRMKCRLFGVNISPLEFFHHNPELIADYIKNHMKDGKIDAFTAREAVYHLHKECTSFRPSILISLVDILGGSRILDFSSGWGDRLIGAMACKKVKFYCGVDPNECLHPNYQAMIEFFKSGSGSGSDNRSGSGSKMGKEKKKYHMIKDRFEVAEIPKEKYDLVITSPPYFDLEMYTGNSSQSISMYNTEDSWFQNFLIVSIHKAWKLLISGGHMCLNINQRRDQSYVYRLLNYMTRFDKCQYRGVISYSDEKISNPQPIWIWKKL